MTEAGTSARVLFGRLSRDLACTAQAAGVVREIVKHDAIDVRSDATGELVVRVVYSRVAASRWFVPVSP